MGTVMWWANLFPPAIPPADAQSQLFFLLLLPLVLFPTAYYLDAKTFLACWEVRCQSLTSFEADRPQIALILLHAFLGTAVSTLIIGFVIWGSNVFLAWTPSHHLCGC